MTGEERSRPIADESGSPQTTYRTDQDPRGRVPRDAHLVESDRHRATGFVTVDLRRDDPGQRHRLRVALDGAPVGASVKLRVSRRTLIPIELQWADLSQVRIAVDAPDWETQARWLRAIREARA